MVIDDGFPDGSVKALEQFEWTFPAEWYCTVRTWIPQRVFKQRFSAER